MKIQIWSDFVCPFCYIGKRHLEQALKESGRDDVEIEMMSYELDPDFVDQPGMSVDQMLANKYGMSLSEARSNNARVKEMAASAGLNYDFDAMKHSNTFKAHKVFQLAKIQGLGHEVSEKFLSGYFEKGAYLNDDEELVKLAVEAGMKEEDVRKALDSDEVGLKVRQDEQWSQMIGAKGVPHFVFDDKVSLSGAQPVETFKQALEYVENLPKEENVGMCEDGVCKV